MKAQQIKKTAFEYMENEKSDWLEVLESFKKNVGTSGEKFTYLLNETVLESEFVIQSLKSACTGEEKLRKESQKHTDRVLSGYRQSSATPIMEARNYAEYKASLYLVNVYKAALSLVDAANQESETCKV